VALSVKQQLFINEYLVDFNATRAAERAGYTGNDNTLAVTGHDLLRKPNIKQAIGARLQESAMTADEVLMRLAEQARGLSAEYVDADGAINIDLVVSNGKTHLIKKIRDTLYGRTYEMYDAQVALRLLGEHHGLFSGSVENPDHVVNYTLDEWRAVQKQRQAQAAQALADLGDDDE